jgi:hypothetical protein
MPEFQVPGKRTTTLPKKSPTRRLFLKSHAVSLCFILSILFVAYVIALCIIEHAKGEACSLKKILIIEHLPKTKYFEINPP